MIGHTISGNEIEINQRRECMYENEFTGYKKYRWASIKIEMNGHTMDIDDLSERNKEWIIDQLPPI